MSGVPKDGNIKYWYILDSIDVSLIVEKIRKNWKKLEKIRKNCLRWLEHVLRSEKTYTV